MRIFDPQRPNHDGFPLGCWPDSAVGTRAALGGKTFPLPQLYVDVGGAEGEWLVTAHMPMSGSAFRGFVARLSSTAELAELFQRWLLDPEGVLLETFKYDPSTFRRDSAVKTAVRERSVATGLAALGLDF